MKVGEHMRRIAQLEAEVQQVSQMAAGAIDRAQDLRARFIELDAEVRRLRAQIPPPVTQCVKCDIPSNARLSLDGCINKSSHEFPVVTQNTENDHGRP